jgi:hypothetical protein
MDARTGLLAATWHEQTFYPGAIVRITTNTVVDYILDTNARWWVADPIVYASIRAGGMQEHINNMYRMNALVEVERFYAGSNTTRGKWARPIRPGR